MRAPAGATRAAHGNPAALDARGQGGDGSGVGHDPGTRQRGPPPIRCPAPVRLPQAAATTPRSLGRRVTRPSRPPRPGIVPRAPRGHRRTVFALLAAVPLLALWVATRPPSPAVTRPRPGAHRASAPGPFAHPLTGGHLQPGSNPAVLPGPVLIADEGNNRLLVVTPRGQIAWEFPGPAGLPPGQTFLSPDDAFFSPTGGTIVATEESDSVISVVDVAQHRILFRYGTPGVPGSGPNQLANPDDAQQLPNGLIFTADIMNCRLLLITPGRHLPTRVFGETTPACLHAPPRRWGSPNGVFPMTNGDFVVTEINGDWADVMTPTGRIVTTMHPPGVLYPSDTNEVRPGVLLTADYSAPGQVVIYTIAGRVLWRYRPLGAAALNHPSLALPLPNGDVLINDDRNDRVIVVDPRTDRVVWQYGVTGRPGSAAGLLNNPDGVDLAPPHSLDITHAATTGSPRA